MRFIPMNAVSMILFLTLLFLMTLSLFGAPLLRNADADVIHLKNGRKITTTRAWKEGDMVKFERFGGIVSYPLSEVERIETDAEAATPPRPRAAVGTAYVETDLAAHLNAVVEPSGPLERAAISTVLIHTYLGDGSGLFITDDGFILTGSRAVAGAFRGLAEMRAKLAADKANLDDWARTLRLQGKTESDNYRAAMDEYKALEAEYQKASDEEIYIRLADNVRMVPRVIGFSDRFGLALMKIDGHVTPTVPPAEKLPEVGDTVQAVISPVLDGAPGKRGLYSGMNQGFFQTNIPLTAEQTGGPMLDADGRLIGVSSDSEEIALLPGTLFAVPVSTAVGQFDELRNAVQ